MSGERGAIGVPVGFVLVMKALYETKEKTYLISIWEAGAFLDSWIFFITSRGFFSLLGLGKRSMKNIDSHSHLDFYFSVFLKACHDEETVMARKHGGGREAGGLQALLIFFLLWPCAHHLVLLTWANREGDVGRAEQTTKMQFRLLLGSGARCRMLCDSARICLNIYSQLEKDRERISPTLALDQERGSQNRQKK